MNPIDALIDSKAMTCGRCGKTVPVWTCGCWEKCSCGWMAVKGQACDNPATMLCTTKALHGMRALTLWEPWASLLGPVKTLETRPMKCAIVGKWVAIHAGSTTNQLARQAQVDPMFTGPLKAAGRTMRQGAIVCLVKFGPSWQVRTTGPSQVPSDQVPFGDFSPGRWVWPVVDFLTVPQGKLPPVKGLQGFWRLPASHEVPLRALANDYEDLLRRLP